LVNSKYIKEIVHIDNKKSEVTPTSQLNFEETYYQREPNIIDEVELKDMIDIPFGKIYGTRSGDKGGCANLGVWAKNSKAYSYLYKYLTKEKLKELLPDLAEYKIDRYELNNINALNFYIHGILEDGISSNNRKDGQAKSLGEYLRAKLISVPSSIMEN